MDGPYKGANNAIFHYRGIMSCKHFPDSNHSSLVQFWSNVRDGDTRHNIDELVVLKVIDSFGLQSVTMYHGMADMGTVGSENAGDYSEAANLELQLYRRPGFKSRFVCLGIQPLTYDTAIR